MRVLWYASQLIESGGGEKFLFEISEMLKKDGHEVQIVCDVLDKENIFAGKYMTDDVICLNLTYKNNNNFLKKSYKKFLGLPILFSCVSSFKPDLIICQSEFDNIRLNLITLFNRIPIRLFVFGQMFQFKSDISKYSYIFRKKLDIVLEKQPDYQMRLGDKPIFSQSPITFITNEIISILKYWSLRKSEKVFVLSNQVRWEVKTLYEKEATVLRGAIQKKEINREKILNPKPIREKPIFLSCCRLDEKKRVDIIIKAFIESNLDGELVIIGDGPHKNTLKKIAESCSKNKKINFLGRVSDEEKQLNIQRCDVFISMDNSDFVISGIEAIAEGKRAIFSNHFEIDSFTSEISGIRLIEPSIESLKKQFNNIFSLDSPRESNIKALEEITWEFVSNKILD